MKRFYLSLPKAITDQILDEWHKLVMSLKDSYFDKKGNRYFMDKTITYKWPLK